MRDLVTDFCLFDPLDKLIFERQRRLRDGLKDKLNTKSIDIRWDYGALEAPIRDRLRDWLLTPTFVVSLPGGEIRHKKFRQGMPWKAGEVLITPESSDLDGIIHETLAACAATRA